MSAPSPSALVARHFRPFILSLGVLTGLLLAIGALPSQVRVLRDQGASLGAQLEVLLLSLPFTLALTIPMAVLVSVFWVFGGVGRAGGFPSATSRDSRVLRWTAPVLAAAAVIAGLTLVLNTQVLPRTNARLLEAMVGAPAAPTDRTMTLGELREAARTARRDPGAEAAARAAGLQVEVQKKLALSAACLVLALVGMAATVRFPRAGRWSIVVWCVVVFVGYFLSLLVGEALAEARMIPPWVGMWTANGVLLGLSALLVWRRPSPDGPQGPEVPLAGAG